MNSEVDLSIIIINYNTFQLTCSCIQSIIDKTNGCTCEIILVDNGSTERPAEDFLQVVPQIKLIQSRVNLGFAKGNNAGIEHALGNYILLLNSDTILINDAIRTCLDFAMNNNSVAVTTARLEYPEGVVQHNCQRFPSVKFKVFELFRIQKILGREAGGKILYGSFFDHRSRAYPDWVWGTFFLFQKRLLQYLPGKKLNDDYFMYGEDMQWCKAFKNLGYRVAFLPEARVLHLMGGSAGKKSEMMETNLNLFMKGNYSWLNRMLIKIFNFLLTGKYEY